jgi:serine protease Do
MSERKIRKSIVAVVVAALVGAVAGSYTTARTMPAAPTIQLAPKVPGLPASESQVSFDEGFAPVAGRVLAAVVNISSSRVVHLPHVSQDSFLSDPLFRQFFGDEFLKQWGGPRERRERSLGSGVIVSQDGYILTNSHVVDRATDIKVFLGNKREFSARVVGTDPQTDIALLKVDAANLPTIAFSDSSWVRVGDFALAVGNPFGVGQTVTMGIISAVGRGGLGIEDYEDFLQTDAAINPGNSGGALVNVRGELIGINTAIVSGSGGNQGVGFAVPANMARSVMDQIIKHGRVSRGWLGVGIQPVTAALGKAFQLPGEARGALINDVRSGSPAEKAGLLAGDVILELDGVRVEDSRELSLAISAKPPGTSIRLKTLRKGIGREIIATLGEQPAGAEQRSRRDETQPSSSGLGFSVRTLTAGISRELGLDAQTRGVVVTAVDPTGAAEDAGILAGDIIIEINHKAVGTAEDFRAATSEPGKAPVLLLIERASVRLFKVVAPR